MFNIIRQDGVKVGPLDMITLLEWRNKGRLLPETILEDVASGNRIRARTLTNLFPPDATPEQLAPNAEAPVDTTFLWDDPDSEKPSQGQIISMYLLAPFWLVARKINPEFRTQQSEAEVRMWNQVGSGGRMAVLLLWGALLWVLVAALFGLYR